MMLVTLDEALRQLNQPVDQDQEITLFIHAASGAVLNYLKSGADYFLDSAGLVITDSNDEPVGVPYEVKAAVLILVGYLYRNRDTNDGFEPGYLPAPVTALLYPLRDPACA